MKFILSTLIILMSCSSLHTFDHNNKNFSLDESSEYITSREVRRVFNGLGFNMKRFGKKKGKIEQIIKKLPYKKKPLIIANDWSQEEYMVISFIIFLSKRLDLVSKTFNIKKYDNWIFGNVPPLEELSGGIAHFDPLPDWKSWWEEEGDSKRIFKKIEDIYFSIANAPNTFRFSEDFVSNKTTKPFISLVYIFSKEMINDNAIIKNMSRSNYREEVIKDLGVKKKPGSKFNSEDTNRAKEQSLDIENNHEVKTDHLSLFRRAYNHVLFIKKRRKFNSENGDSIELLPNWWEKEMDIITAIILTIFKYQYRHRMKIIEAENNGNNNCKNWKEIKCCLKQAISCTSNWSSDNSLEHIAIWHRFGEKWQSFPQGAMIRILDNVSKLSLMTSSWDVYDYVICLCFYYLIKREKIRIDWFTLGPLSGPPKTRFWRIFRRFMNKIFSPNNGMFDMSNKWHSSYVEPEQ